WSCDREWSHPMGKRGWLESWVDSSREKERMERGAPVLALTRLMGDFPFDSAIGLSGKGIKAQAFERPVTAEIAAEGKPGDHVTRIVAHGPLTLQRLTDWLHVTQPLPVSGDLRYQLQVPLASNDRPLATNAPPTAVATDCPGPHGITAAPGRPSDCRRDLHGPR
ncbi:TIGR02099 family protein, partial [Pseudomonas syringae]